MSHWMTFGGLEMLVLLLVCAHLFGTRAGRTARLALSAGAALIALAIVLGLTRGIWAGVAAGGCYLLWHWKRWLLAAAPVVLLAGFFVAPPAVRERLTSSFRPHGEVDSNQHRLVTWRTGWQMIKAHPLLGLGPEQVNRQFKSYVPADIPQPLPTGWYGHLHNIYLHYAAERGIPTMLMLVWMLVTILRDFHRALARRDLSDEARSFLRGATAAVIAIMTTGVFEHNLGDSEVLILFLAVVSCGYVAAGSGTREQEEVVVHG